MRIPLIQLHSTTRRSRFARIALVTLLVLGGLTAVDLTPQAAPRQGTFAFELFPPGVLATCLPDAHGDVTLVARGEESRQMLVRVSGLTPNTTYTVFVTQLPHPPFGLSWYQGDIVTDKSGKGSARFAGIFSDETFIVAPGSGPAPVLHPGGRFPDGATNPVSPPIHTLHIGLWFDSIDDAVAAGCPNIETPFSGEHEAGLLVLSSSAFADDDGPLGHLGE